MSSPVIIRQDPLGRGFMYGISLPSGVNRFGRSPVPDLSCDSCD